MMFKSFLVAGVLFLLTGNLNAQCVVSSTDGYQVNISIIPRAIIVSTTDCPWGYNYNVQLDYQVSFSGSNIPSSLYTLQTTISCGGQSNSYYTLPLSGGSGTSVTSNNPYIPNGGSAYYYPTYPDCQHATVQTLNCNSISVLINGPGIPTQTISCDFPMDPLPVELIDYKATNKENSVLLEWSTASEMRNSHFTIYRSGNGTDWTKMTSVAGAGTSTDYHAYNWFDESPLYGISYYKLVQTDLDGVTENLGILSVERVDNENSSSQVYPNPSATGDFTVRIVTENDEPVTIIVKDQLGRVIQETIIQSTATSGKNRLLQDVLHVGAANAMYQIELIQENEVIGRHKVVVKA